MKAKFKYKSIIYLFLTVGLLSCRKLIEIDMPIDRLTSKEAFSSTSDAVAVMNGIYTSLRNLSFSTEPSLFSDELFPGSSGSAIDSYTNNYTSQTTYYLWELAYRSTIYKINSLIEGVTASKELPLANRQILIGEAKFMRAFAYFYLVNYYGNVPLVLTTDFKVNSIISRTEKNSVYTQIVQDLKSAQELLPDIYLNSDLATRSSERIRPNKFAATALLSRVFLYMKDYSSSELEASRVIENKAMYDLVPLSDVFLKDNMESIWQIQPVKSDLGTNVAEARNYVDQFGVPGLSGYGLTDNLMNSFEVGDRRRVVWIRTGTLDPAIQYAPYKYKIGQGNINQTQEEYDVVIRLAELYLIRAEARAYRNKLTGKDGAMDDLNVIRVRAGLLPKNLSELDEILHEIMHERRVELFTEFGHRWLDLKRTGMIDEIMSEYTPKKGGTWDSFKALLPIPSAEFERNPSLHGQQNPGYSEQ